MAGKYCIDVGAGVIDADFSGEIQVMLYNHCGADFKFNKGDRVAQLILERNETPEIEEVTSFKETARGENGVGSTGGVSCEYEKACSTWNAEDNDEVVCLEGGIGN